MGKSQPKQQPDHKRPAQILPEDLISYIVYHETAHNVERKHNDTFWSVISKRFPNHNDKEKDLLTYWFLIQKQAKCR